MEVDDFDGADAFVEANAARFSDAPEAALRGMRRGTEVLRMALEERQASMRRALASDRARALSLETCAFAAGAGCLDIAYEALFAALKNAKVGRKGASQSGEEDQKIVAQAILATREPGAVPTFVVADQRILKPLLRHFSADFQGEGLSFPIREKYPQGFIIEIKTSVGSFQLKIQPLTH
jgi:hypothetical protein